MGTRQRGAAGRIGGGLPWLGLLFVATFWFLPAIAQSPPAAETFDLERALHLPEAVGFTTPFRTAILAGLQQGQILRFLSDEGAPVRRGDVLVELDATVQERRAEIARLEAESTLRVDLARVRVSLAEKDMRRVLQLRNDATVSSQERDETVAELEAARLSLALATLEQQQAVERYRLQRELLDQMKVRAPFDGYVTEHLKELGETVEEREGLVKLVQLDPLVVLVDCPLSRLPALQVGAQCPVRPQDPAWSPRTGTIVVVNPVADPASQTFRVKLQVPNPGRDWVSGMRVVVDFDAVTAAPPTEPATATVRGAGAPRATDSKTGPPSARSTMQGPQDVRQRRQSRNDVQ